MSDEKQDIDNMRIWDRVCMTDPKHVKPITGKDYGGNSPKPYWIVRRLTEEFGPCGIGWGYDIESERFDRFSETDTLHVAKVRFWYLLDGKRGEVVQMGQTKASYTTGNGKFKVDEDAPKKSVTDALVKCASYLGFAGDIFMGLWDDSKYVQQAAAHYADDPLKGRKTIIELAALLAVEKFKKGDQIGAYEEISGITDNEEKLYLWGLLKEHSSLRAFIKKHAQELREAETA